METVATFEQVLEMEKQLVAERQRAEWRAQLEQLRPGLVQLLQEAGFELYALGDEQLYVQRGIQRAILRLQELQRAQQKSPAALLERFGEAVEPLQEDVFLMRLALCGLVVVVTALVVAIRHTQHGWQLWAGQAAVGVGAAVVGVLFAGVAWPQLQLQNLWPWVAIYKRNPPAGWIAL